MMANILSDRQGYTYTSLDDDVMREVDETGRYRSGGVGIFRGEQLVHMAPPADQVPKLMATAGWGDSGKP